MHSKLIALVAVWSLAVALHAQVAPAHPATSDAQVTSATIALTLADALARAKANSPQFQAALMQLGLAREDRVQARAALLPGVDYNNGFTLHRGQSHRRPAFSSPTTACTSTSARERCSRRWEWDRLPTTGEPRQRRRWRAPRRRSQREA